MITHNPSKCGGCQLCVDSCPNKAIVVDVVGNLYIDKDACLECGACVKECPMGAMEKKDGKD